MATAAASSYIRRLRECDVRDRVAVVDAATYMLRRDQLERARAEVVGHAWFSRGTARPEDVWPAVDAKARTQTGDYHKRAGGVPRLAILAEFSLPWGLPEDEKIRLAHQLAQDIVDEYGAFVEVACHRKSDALERGVDHCHLLISMREVDEDGKVGRMIRRFNGIASSMSDDKAIVGERALSGHIVWMRKRWADMLTQATKLPYDWRSYADAGVPFKPVTPFGRGALEKARSEGSTELYDQRQAELAARQREMTLYARQVDDRRAVSTHDGSLASAIVRRSPRLRTLQSFSPAGLLAAKAAADTQGRRAVMSPQVEIMSPSATTPGRWAFPPALAEPAALRRSIATPASPAPRAATSHMRPVVATGASAIPPQAKDPKDNLSTLVARQWAAVDQKERDAAMARFLADIDARAAAIKNAKPAKVPVFRVLSEGGPPDGAKPPRISQPPIPPVSDTAVSCAILFGAALIASNWRTANAEASLANAVGMDRAAFATATQARARDIEKPAEARQQARVGAPPALLHLFEEIEDERLEAKKRRRKQQTRAPGDEASMPSGPDRHATGSSALPPIPTKPVPETRPTSVSTSTRGVSGAPPLAGSKRLSNKAIHALLQLAALLSWKGNLQRYLNEIVGLSGLPESRVREEANGWLVAFAQMKVPKSDLWTTVVATARAVGDARLSQFVDRIAREGSQLPHDGESRKNAESGVSLKKTYDDDFQNSR